MIENPVGLVVENVLVEESHMPFVVLVLADGRCLRTIHDSDVGRVRVREACGLVVAFKSRRVCVHGRTAYRFTLCFESGGCLSLARETDAPPGWDEVPADELQKGWDKMKRSWRSAS